MDYPITVQYTIMVYNIHMCEVGDSIVAMAYHLLESK